MAHEKTEVGTKLTLDDEASEAIKHVAEGFEHVKERVHEAGHELVGMAKQAATFAIGFQLSGAIESLKEFGHELVEGGIHLEEQKRGLTGMLALTDKGAESFEDLSKTADELNEHFETLALTTGTTKDQMIDAFEMISARSTRTSEEISSMVELMAEASKRLPGGMESLSGAWRDLEAGFIRPRNALIQLMKQTGVVEGSNKQIAKSLMGMIQGGHQDEVFKMAEEAIERMAAKMKDVPLTFGQIVQSLKGAREMLFETMGTPLIRAIAPQLEQLRAFMAGHREEFAHLAEVMGIRVGQWVTKAGEEIADGFRYLKDHADEILDALERGGAAIKDAIAFMVEHRTLLLALAGAYYGQKGLGAVAGALPGIGQTAGSLAGAGLSAAGRMAAGAGATTPGGAMAVGGAVGALGIADVLVWGEAARQASALEQESGLSWTQAATHALAGWTGVTAGISEASDRALNFKAAMARWNETVTDGSHHSVAELQALQKQIHSFAVAMVNDGDMTKEAAMKIEKSMKDKIDTEQRHSLLLAQMQMTNAQETEGLVREFGAKSVSKTFADSYRAAAAEDAKAALESARVVLEANKVLREALAGTGASVEEAVKALEGLAGGKDKGKGMLPPINFGPSTFNVKQDFRDQDADKVAIVFRQDVTRHAVARVAAKTGSPFGI